MQRTNRAGKVSGEEWARLLAALSLGGMLLRGGQGKAGKAGLLTDWARLGCRDAGGGDHGERGGAEGARSGSVCARRGSPSARGLPRTRAAGRGVGTPAAGDRPTAPDATMATDSKCRGPRGRSGDLGWQVLLPRAPAFVAGSREQRLGTSSPERGPCHHAHHPVLPGRTGEARRSAGLSGGMRHLTGGDT